MSKKLTQSHGRRVPTNLETLETTLFSYVTKSSLSEVHVDQVDDFKDILEQTDIKISAKDDMVLIADQNVDVANHWRERQFERRSKEQINFQWKWNFF